MGLFGRLKQGLSRTTQSLVSTFGDLVRRVDQGPSGAVLDADTAESLEEILIAADVGVGAAHAIVEAVRTGAAGDGLRARVKHEILRMFHEASHAHPPSAGGAPRVVLLVGVNGVGKTTTLGKLAAALKAAGQTPMVCAADTFRASPVWRSCGPRTVPIRPRWCSTPSSRAARRAVTRFLWTRPGACTPAST